QPSASLNCQWDLNGNGIFGETGASATHGDEVGINPTFQVGNLPAGTDIVKLRVTNRLGLISYATAVIHITVVPPTLSINGPTVVDEGSPYTLNLSATVPGGAPLLGWQITWGDGTSNNYPGTATMVTHVYRHKNAGAVISATATDRDGSFAAGN